MAKKPSARKEVLSRLRRRIAAIERAGITGADKTTGNAAPLGVAPVDEALPWSGLPRGSVHEIAPRDAREAAAASGFCAALASRLVGGAGEESKPAPAEGHLIWCLSRAGLFEHGRPHGMGLIRFGLEPARALLLAARNDDDLLWAMEEALDCTALTAVIGEIGEIGRVASRRLALKADKSGVTVFLRRPPGAVAAIGAVSRWQIAAAPSVPSRDRWGAKAGGPGRPRWNIALLHARGGKPHNWTLEWNDETHHFDLAAPLAERSPADQSRPQAGQTPPGSRLAG